MLDILKLSLRITTDAFDDELEGLIDSALLDLSLGGVTCLDPEEPLVKRAIITYVKLNFGEPSDPDRLKASYDEQKSQLRTASGYTRW